MAHFPTTQTARIDSLAEWSKALASGANPKGRGLDTHSCQSCPACCACVEHASADTLVRSHPMELAPRSIRQPLPTFPAPPSLPTRLPSLRAHVPPSFRLPDVLRSIRAPMSAATQFIVRPILLQPSTTPRHWPPLGFVALTLWAAYLWRRLEKSWLSELDAARSTPHSPFPRCLLLVSVSYAPMGARWLWTHVLALSGRSVVLWIRRAV